MFDDIPRPTCRSVYTVSDKRLRHGGSGYETRSHHMCSAVATTKKKKLTAQSNLKGSSSDTVSLSL